MFGWSLHVFTGGSTWGQAEPAVPRWPLLKHNVKQVVPVTSPFVVNASTVCLKMIYSLCLLALSAVAVSSAGL